jgi:hypothetical protein
MQRSGKGGEEMRVKAIVRQAEAFIPGNDEQSRGAVCITSDARLQFGPAGHHAWARAANHCWRASETFQDRYVMYFECMAIADALVMDDAIAAIEKYAASQC